MSSFLCWFFTGHQIKREFITRKRTTHFLGHTMTYNVGKWEKSCSNCSKCIKW